MVVVQVRQAPKELKINFKFGRRHQTRDIVIMTRQFATMINSGLPLVQGALDILAQQTENKALSDVLRRRGVRRGERPQLADALPQAIPGVPDLFVTHGRRGRSGAVFSTPFSSAGAIPRRRTISRAQSEGRDMIYPA